MAALYSAAVAPRLVVALSVLILLPATAGAATVTWISNVSGFWDVGANWDTGTAPQAGDDVIIDRPGLTITVTIRVPTATIRSLLTTEFLQSGSVLSVTDTVFLDGGLTLTGTIQGGASVALRSAGTWTSGTLSNGSLTVAAGNTLTVSSTAAHQLSGATLTNQGTIAWTQGAINLISSSTLVNAAGALWDAPGDRSLSASGSASTFTNAGMLRKSAGTGNFQVIGLLTVTNTGTLQIEAGRFVCSCTGLVTSGVLDVSAGATIDLNNATLQPGSTFAGSGTLDIGGTTLAGSVTVSQPITLTGALTSTGHTLTVASPMIWSSGGSLTNVNLAIGPGGTLALDSPTGVQLNGSTLTNQGTVTWTQGTITLANSSHLVNAVGALWDLPGNRSLSASGSGSTFTNAGILRKSAGTGNFQISGPLTVTNTGTLQIQAGRFSCSCTALFTSGVLDASAGTTIDLSAVTLQAGSTFVGSGSLDLGNTTLAGPVTVTLPMTLGGTLTSTGHTLTVAAPLTWQSGTLSNLNLVIGAGQTLTVLSVATHNLSAATLTNQGTFTWIDGSIGLLASSHIVNASGGIWEIQGSKTLGGHAVTNAGTLRFTGPIGRLDLQSVLAFTNTGIIEVRLAGHSAGFDGSDYVQVQSATLGGTLDVQLVPGFVPVVHDTWHVVRGASTGTFAALNGNGSQYALRYTEFSARLKPVVAPGTELIRNGTFSDQLNFWTTFSTPDPSYISASVVNEALEFYRVPPPPGQSNQATVFQETSAYVPANAPLVATFDLSNTSSVRKRITVLITESDFSDLAVCTFWLPANSPTRTYGIRAHTTQVQWNVALYFYAASAGSNGGAYRIDNVSLRHDPNLPSDRTDCVDPLAPGPVGGSDGSDLLVNGNFNTGALAPWFTFGTITWQLVGGVFEFVRPGGGISAGVVVQPTSQSMTTGQLLTTTLELGNSSSVRKRVTLIVHDFSFGDLAACTFWLPPGQPLSPYVVRSYTTQPWTNATVSVYAASTSLNQWIRVDNVTLQQTPSITVGGTECLEPGANLTRPQAQRVASLRPAPAAVAVPAASFPEAATASLAVPRIPTRAATFTVGMAWQRVFDLRSVTDATLSVELVFADPGSSGLAQVSLDGVDWITVATLPALSERTTIDLDLSAFAGDIVHVRVLYQNHPN